MMKKIAGMMTVALFAVLVILGCGSNTKLDPLPPPPPGSTYAFVNASTPLDIDESDKDYNLSVQLVDGAFGLPGETIKMATFDSKYGIVDPAEVETDDSGWAHFSYHSPDDLRDVGGQSITLQAVLIIYNEDDDNNETAPVGSMTQDFVLNFAVIPEGNLYHLTNQSTPIIVVVDTNDTNGTGSTTKEISAYVVDKDNVGVKGQTVTIGILDQRFGSISPASTQTDAAGKASFTYTVSDTIASQIGNSTTVNMYYKENETTTSLPVTIEVTTKNGCQGNPGTCP